jgi:hypothetical protein
MSVIFPIHILLAQLQGPASAGMVPPPPVSPGGAPVPQGPLNALAAQGEELRDIAPPVDVPFWNLETRLMAGVAAVALAVLVWSLVRRWQRRPRPAVAPPDPLKVALAALLRLDGEEGRTLADRDFAAAVAEVLRRFLEARHQLAAPRQTTEEFLEMAERSNRFPQTVREQLHHFLRRCDELKFARADATDTGRRGLLILAEEMLRGALS